MPRTAEGTKTTAYAYTKFKDTKFKHLQLMSQTCPTPGAEMTCDGTVPHTQSCEGRREGLSRRLVGWGWGSATHASDDLRIHGLREHAAPRGDVVHQLVERGALHLLALQVGHRVHEVERDAALAQLPDEQLLLLRRRHIWRNKRTPVITESPTDGNDYSDGRITCDHQGHHAPVVRKKRTYI